MNPKSIPTHRSTIVKMDPHFDGQHVMKLKLPMRAGNVDARRSAALEYTGR